jgi:hypothetical protein
MSRILGYLLVSTLLCVGFALSQHQQATNPNSQSFKSSITTPFTPIMATVSPYTSLILGGQTLTPGGVITVGSDVLSLASTEIFIISTAPTPSTVTIGPTTLQLNTVSQVAAVVLGGQTLTPGGVITAGSDILSMSSTEIFVISNPYSSPSIPSSSPSTSSSSNNSESLNTGAKAGIGVAAAIAGILILSAITGLFFYHGRRSLTSEENPKFEKAEMSGVPKPMEELGGERAGVYSELNGREAAMEIGGRELFELQ